MRVVICGAGAVGGSIGGLLAADGTEVVLVARGAHLEAIRADGLRLLSPDESRRLEIPAVDSVAAVDWCDGDVAVVATKLQDAPALLDELALAAPDGTRVVAAQNGLAGERMAARRGFDAYGMLVWMPTTYLEPGEVRIHGTPVPGVLDVGRWPGGVDDFALELTDRLRSAGFASKARADIMAWKRAKLKTNVVGMFRAVVAEFDRELADELQAETAAVFSAAGLDVVPWEELRDRGAGVELAPVEGMRREGSSAWQSLERGVSSEVNFLCGEVVLLGKEFALETPLNRAVQRATHRIVREGRAPRSVTSDELRALCRDG